MEDLEEVLVTPEQNERAEEIVHTQMAWQTRSALHSPLHPISFFNSTEHELIGENLSLPFSNERIADSTTFRFHLPNGLDLTFGEIIALAGDFFALPTPMSITPFPEAIFQLSYNVLATNPIAVQQTSQIKGVLKIEEIGIARSLQQGKSAYDAYEAFGNTLDKAFNKITGGGDGFDWFLKHNWGTYMILAYLNFDHFGEGALASYKAGLNLAIKKAIEASHATTTGTKDGLLAEAYTLLAYANHFFTDLFSAGHLRTPRKELFMMADSDINRQYAGYLAKMMHDEDNYNGLWAYNGRGDKWVVYGDARYRDNVNTINRNVLHHAVQASINDVYSAFTSGSVPPQPSSLSYIPQLNYNKIDTNNYAPLFALDNGAVVIRNRVSIPDLQCYNFHPITPLNIQQLFFTFNSGGIKIGRIGSPPRKMDVTGPDIKL